MPEFWVDVTTQERHLVLADDAQAARTAYNHGNRVSSVTTVDVEQVQRESRPAFAQRFLKEGA